MKPPDTLTRRTRDTLGLSQSALARSVKTTVSRVSRVERGTELFGFAKTARLAQCLKLDHKKVVASVLQSLVDRAELNCEVKLTAGASKKRPRVGEEIARLRYSKGVTVRGLAKVSGFLPSRIAKVENDADLVLQPATAARFAEALGATQESLIELALQDLLAKHRLSQFRVKVKPARAN